MVVPDIINDDDGRGFTTFTRVVLVTCVGQVRELMLHLGTLFICFQEWKSEITNWSRPSVVI